MLYVSGTQDQADMHVQAIGALFEKLGTERSVSKYGHSKGWRRNQLRTATGFNVAALGLDVAARGVKLEEFRPDMIIFDDIDSEEDSERTISKKIRAITKKLIPAGSIDCAILFVQNLIHEEGIVSGLVSGRVDFLSDRECFVEPAVNGLEWEYQEREDGFRVPVILSGIPTWEGQSLEICEKQMKEWGTIAFLQESQHDLEVNQGHFFNVAAVQTIPHEVAWGRDFVALTRGWDYAATQNDGDFSVGSLEGMEKNGRVTLLDVVRAQVSPDNLDELKRLTQEWDKSVWGDRVRQVSPQDPGAAGKIVSDADHRLGFETELTTGNKAVRAKGYASCVNAGNFDLCQDGYSRTPELDKFLEKVTKRSDMEGKTKSWNHAWRMEHKRFREDNSHKYDDQIDSGATAYNGLTKPRFTYQVYD